ncbi:MAG: ParB/RepB/Spo0J family partition protein [Candidatus Margulisbacteria bacterium]|nr:ParB/RepB/Spo0J family partition protein [Candidatus Margulisiibacteriota bacterium]
MKIAQIRLDKLNHSSPQLRKDLRYDLEELKTSIESEGIVFPIVVRKSGSEYIIIDGNRRVMALDELGADPSTLVPAVVVDVHKDREALRMEMIANLVRRNLLPMEEAEVIHLLVNSYDMQAIDVAKALGRSRGRVSELLKIFTLPKEVLRALRADKICIRHARTLAQYAEDPDLVLKILAKILKDKIGAEDIVSIAYIMSLKGKSPIPVFSPEVRELKDGSRVRIEPRKKSIRIEVNYNPEGKISAVFSAINEKLDEIF